MRKTIIIYLLASCCSISRRENDLIYTIQKEYPHDKNAFTQGLVMHNGKLFESTGSKNSGMGTLNLASGRFDKKVELSDTYFGEGITILNNKIYQLTWKNKIGFIYNLQSFEKIGQFNYSFDGWGITTDNTYLIVSDGTDKLYYLDTLHFETVKTLSVRYNNRKVKKLNELEYVDGHIFANHWGKNHILKIDLSGQKVVGKIDLSSLAKQMKKRNSKAQAPNGIAYDKQTNELIITGKYWPNAYAIQLEDDRK